MKRQRWWKSAILAALVAGTGASTAWAVPTNTSLPGGWWWQPLPGGTYDTGLMGTKRGGFNGQTSPPFNDTSFGIMNEPGTPWYDGSDLSAQQYVQRQIFGNFGTSSPPGPPGFRYYNFGYGGTAAGSNFPRTATERRIITLNHWNNPHPDAGGVATYGQVVYVPVSATLYSGIGWGADEMLLKVIGGTSGQQSQFFVDATLNASFSTPAFGGISATGNTIRVNAVTRVNDAGPGHYDVTWGYGVSGGLSQWRVDAIDAVFINGVYVAEPGQGIPINSVGYAFTNSYNVLPALIQNGGTFTITYNADADINNLVRDWGNADVRASMGPGMEGSARLVVVWEAFMAVPEPATVALLLLGGAGAMSLRRR